MGTLFFGKQSLGDVEILNLLLRDQRLKYLPDHEGTSPLYLPYFFRYFERVQWVLCLRGREIGDKEMKTLIKVATQKNHIEIASLLKRFNQNCEQVISQLKVELEPPGNSALLFAALVFLEDGLLKLKEKSKKRNTKRRLRFFRMALQLPTELQMQLCHRVYELNDYIPNMLALSAFKKLATDLRPPFLSFPPASVSLFLIMGIMLLGIVLVLLYLCELL